MGGLRGRLARLREKVGKGAVLVEQRDGTRRYFSEMAVFREKFLAQCDLIRGQPPKDSSGIIAAVLAATPESRQEFEQRFGRVLGKEVHIISTDFVEVRSFTECGTLEKVRHTGVEAERIRQEVRRNAAGGSFL